MNLSYFISVMGSKILALVTLLSLSYFMKPTQFGQFALISTNALFAQLLFGSWITSSANRFVSLLSVDNLQKEISLIIRLVMVVSIALLIVSLIYTYWSDLEFRIAISIFYFASSIIVFDIILAILNAKGNADRYAQLSLFRAFSGFVFPVIVAASGGSGVQVALASATAVTFSMLIFRAPRSTFRNVTSLNGVLTGARRYLSFGFGGALVLGLYVLIHAPTRNLIAYFEGLDAAGHWTITSDIFYGPLAIAGTIATLSANRLLHRWNQQTISQPVQDASTPYLQSLLLVSLPYAAVGYLFAADIAPLIFSSAVSANVAVLAPQICIQNAAILIIYGLCYIALTKERWCALYFSIGIATIFPSFTSILIVADAIPWLDITNGMTVSTVVCATLITITYLMRGIVQIYLKDLTTIALLTGMAILIIFALRLLDTSSLATLFACAVGGVIYLISAHALGLIKINLVSEMER